MEYFINSIEKFSEKIGKKLFFFIIALSIVFMYFIIYKLLLINAPALNDKKELHLVLNSILSFIFLCFAILLNLFKFKYDIDKDKFIEKVNKIKFAKNRQGTDGICCFLTFKDTGVPFPRKKDKILVRAALTQKKDNRNLEVVIKNEKVKTYAYHKRCIKLQLDHKIENGNLEVNFKCGDYDNRPQACKNYPSKTTITCRLSEYCSKPKEQIEFFDWSLIHLYGFDSKKFPEMKSFSVGVAKNIRYKYYLVPVPFKDENYKDYIYCK